MEDNTAGAGEAVAAYCARADRPTGVVVIGRDGTTSRFGRTDVEIEVASVTKLVVALAAWVACEEGAISIDDAAGPVGATVAHLLAHAAGYSFDDATVLAAPGTRRIYSNHGFTVLAEHIESRTGIGWRDYVTEAVLTPLGMHSSRLIGSAGAGLAATGDDLALLAAELRTPSLIDGRTHARAVTETFAGLSGILPGFGHQNPCPWGLGVEIRGHKSPHWTSERNDPTTFGHFGAGGSFIWIDPSVAVAAVLCSDVPFGAWAVTRWPVLSGDLLDIGLEVGTDNRITTDRNR